MSVSSSSPSDHLASDPEGDDDEDDSFADEGAGEYEEVEDDAVVEKGDLQKYYENNANFKDLSQKLPFMYGIAASFEKPPNLSESPYSHKKFTKKKKSFTFMVATLVLESVRRGSKRKSRTKTETLLQYFRDNPLDDTDTAFVNKILLEHKNFMERECKEYDQANPTTEQPATKRVHMRTSDKFRLIMAFFHDDVKEKLRTTQELLSRDELDARNSIAHKAFDYFAAVADVFNDDDWVALIPAMPFLHDGMKEPQSIPRSDFTITRDKVKTVFSDMRAMLFPIAGAYEKSGNGGDQRLENDEDWGTTNLMEVETMDGDDRKKFLTLEGKAPENSRHWYILYFWHMLEEQGLLQFALAKLPKHMLANSEQYSLVSMSKNSRSGDNKAKLAASVELVANGINAFATTVTKVQYQLTIDENKEKIFELEMKIEDPDNKLPTKDWMVQILKKRKLELENTNNFLMNKL